MKHMVVITVKPCGRLNITHQQLQKYETGTNRVTAVRLAMIARALDTDVKYFYGSEEDLPNYRPQHERLAMEVSKKFMKIKDAQQQIAVSKLIDSLV